MSRLGNKPALGSINDGLFSRAFNGSPIGDRLGRNWINCYTLVVMNWKVKFLSAGEGAGAGTTVTIVRLTSSISA